MTSLRETIGTNIKRYRDAAGLTQEQLAQKVGKVKSAISNWETGTHSPDAETFMEICRVLNVMPSTLYGMDEIAEITDGDISKAVSDLADIMIDLPSAGVNFLLDLAQLLAKYSKYFVEPRE